MSLLTRGVEFQIDSKSASERVIVGMITTDDVDRYNEVVDPKGAVLENYRKNPVVLLNHNSWSGLPIGRNRWIKPSQNGLVASTEFANTTEGRDVFALYSEGFMKAWSIGFLPKKWEDANASESGYRRKYTSWELLEYSAVTIPANPEAVSNMLRSVESERVREAIERAQHEINTERRVDDLFFTVNSLSSTTAEIKAALEELTALKGLTDMLAKLSDKVLLIEKVLIDSPEPPVTTTATAPAPKPSETEAERKQRIVALVTEVVGRQVEGIFKK